MGSPEDFRKAAGDVLRLMRLFRARRLMLACFSVSPVSPGRVFGDLLS
jgi:hypothetical protein